MFRQLTTPALALVLVLTTPLQARAQTVKSKLWLDGIRNTVKTRPEPETETESSQKWLEAQIKHFPDQAPLYYQLGLLQIKANKLPEAAASFATALKLNPRLYAAAWQLGAIQLKSGQAQAVRQTLEPLVASWGVDPELTYLLGLSYLQLGLRSQALQAFEKVLLLSPGHPAIKYRDALRQELPRQKLTEAGPMLVKAENLLKTGQRGPGNQVLSQLLLIHPEEKKAYALLAGSLETMGQFATAANWREQLLSLDPCYENNDALLGRWLLWSGFLDRASQLLQNQLACQPAVEAARWLGQLYRQRGQWELALAHYQTYLAQWPGDSELLSGLASTMLALGRPEDARKVLNQIKVPGAEALVIRSQLSLLSGQPDLAIKDLNQALRMNNRPEFRKNLVLAYIQAGMGDSARQELSKYLQARPAEANSLQALMEQIKLLPKRGKFTH